MKKTITNIFSNSKNYFVSHQAQFLLILILFILSNYISEVPYLNLLATFWVRMGLLWIISVTILKLKIRVSLIASLILAAVIIFLSILKEKEVTELLGNILYFLLLTIFIQCFWRYLKEIKLTSK